MLTEAARLKRNAYMREWHARNKERVNAERRAQREAAPSTYRARDKVQRERRIVAGGKTAKQREQAAAWARSWRAKNTLKAKLAKRKYYASDKGRAQKRKEDAAYVASGRRAITEARRAAAPLSQARQEAKRANSIARRSLSRERNELDAFVLREAARLRDLRYLMLGTRWHVDHVVPVAKGGSSSADNLQVVPAVWNRRKSDVHTERFFGAR